MFVYIGGIVPTRTSSSVKRINYRLKKAWPPPPLKDRLFYGYSRYIADPVPKMISPKLLSETTGQLRQLKTFSPFCMLPHEPLAYDLTVMDINLDRSCCSAHMTVQIVYSSFIGHQVTTNKIVLGFECGPVAACFFPTGLLFIGYILGIACVLIRDLITTFFPPSTFRALQYLGARNYKPPNLKDRSRW